MTYVNFNDIDFSSENGNGNNGDIKFFSLKQDKEFAVVRFIQNTTDDFEIVAVHEVEVPTQNGGVTKRKVNCLRGANDPLERCPFCETNQKLQRKFFVHLVKYEQTQSGIVGVPMVWERPLSFAKDLANKIQTYGAPLSDHVFKITRNGAPRDMHTTYTIDYLPPQCFPENIYQKMENSFEGYSAVGGIVLNKSPEDMIAFVRDGRFPFNQNNNAQQTATNSNFAPVQNIQGANFAPAQGVQNANNVVNNIPANNVFFNPASGFNGGAIQQAPQQFTPNQQFPAQEGDLPWNTNNNVIGAPVRKN